MKTITKLSLIALMICGFTVANAQLPTTVPPQLDYEAAEVLSFVSEKYGTDFEYTTPNWGSPASWNLVTIVDETELTLKISNLDSSYIALQLKDASARLVNYEYVHVDVFCNEETQFRIGFHSHYPGNHENYFPMIEKGTMAPGKWYSIEYSIDDFYLQHQNWVGTTDAHYLRFGGDFDGKKDWSNEIYVANFILFNGTPTCLGGKVIDGPSSIRGTENDSFSFYVANNTLNCSAQESIKQINVYSLTGQLAASANGESVDVSNLISGVYIVSAELVNGETVSKRFMK